MRIVEWVSCVGGWCRLKDLFLDGMRTHYGVYIIWRRGVPSRRMRVLYVGQGNIRRWIRQHRHNIRAYPKGREGDLRVTWALVESESERSGIERYLADELKPRFGKKWPRVEPVPVNLPQMA